MMAQKKHTKYKKQKAPFILNQKATVIENKRDIEKKKRNKNWKDYIDDKS